ncbi:MAG: hypothetical protein K2X82_01175, partial [Gemmataceae bacterium]|nr:hypothetical protein [Gemmataceae bacterium]
VLSAAEFADPAVGDPSGAECIFLCDVPNLTPAVVAKLEAHLKRGGGLVIGLGPNAATAREQYNRLLYADGNGPLPGPLVDVVTAPPDDPGFRLYADEQAFRQTPTPLSEFRDENARAGLVTVPFRSYLRMDAPADGRARRLLSFVPAAATVIGKPDPAVVEWTRHRGRVVVYTSTFDRDWTEWPVLPSYLPFAHQLLRFAAANPDRHTARVGDQLEEFFPPAAAGLTAGLSGPDGLTATIPVTMRDEVGFARFAETNLSGLYRLGLGSARDRVFAVNPPETAPGGGTEFDLRRVPPAELSALGPVQVVDDPADATPAGDEAGAFSATTPRPHGPTLARWALWAALTVMLVEVFLAWRLGPARTPGAGSARPPDRRPLLRLLGTAAALVPLAVAAVALLIVVRVEWASDVAEVVPASWWHAVEDGVAWLAGVPPAPAGESTRVVLERSAVVSRDPLADRWALAGLAAGFVALTVAVYRRERTAAGGWRRVVVPALLRAAGFLVVLAVFLPQWRLVFKREGWPDVAVILDTSASMVTVDDFKDPSVRAKAVELAGADGVSQAHRLKLAQLLLTRPGNDWLDRLLTEKRVRVHVYAADASTRPVGTASEDGDAVAVRAALLALKPEGDESRLGEAVRKVGKDFQGGSLAGVVFITDGVTTAGPDLPAAADGANAPLYLVGVGDPWVVPDLRLSDPVLEDVVVVGDTLDIRARLTARGAVPPDAVPVVLYEKVGGRLVERGRTTAPPAPAGAAVKVTYTPTEPGEKTLVLEVPTVPGEADTANNRIERRVLVTEGKKARVLFVEGDPRYDFRFAKTLFEREADRAGRGKAVEFKTVLLGAGRGWAETDRSALADFPTRDQLFEYDVVILGDFDPKLLPRSSRVLQDVADFVKVRGGGLLVVAGEHHSPAAFADTPLADVLPVVPAETPPRPTPEDRPLVDGYRPALTPTGKSHPLFRFSPDPAEADRVWKRLQPLLWHASGYRRKPAAEVLAVHPDRPAEGGPGRENHPLAVQQFVGAGRVIFLGFDETWRWRFRTDEAQFNRFWTQAVRVLARSRRSRTELKLEPGGGPYRRGDRITIRVRFPDDAPPPADDAAVRVRVEREPLTNQDGSAGPGEPATQELSLIRVKGERAEYEAVIPDAAVGDYRFTLTGPDPGATPPRAEARVQPPPAEKERIDLNRADLSAAAARSHGGFYTLADAEKLFDDLRNLEPIALNEPRPPRPLWNDPAVYALFGLLLTAEWLLRKRERLL